MQVCIFKFPFQRFMQTGKIQGVLQTYREAGIFITIKTTSVNVQAQKFKGNYQTQEL